jgi:hypothetical protein
LNELEPGGAVALGVRPKASELTEPDLRGLSRRALMMIAYDVGIPVADVTGKSEDTVIAAILAARQ